MPKFATYLHPQIFSTSKPIDQIEFVGNSLPHFSKVRTKLAEAVADCPTFCLPLKIEAEQVWVDLTTVIEGKTYAEFMTCQKRYDRSGIKCGPIY